jgi:ketosteroid isomerase-like protein
MHSLLHAQIAEAEDQLRTAMLSSDVAALNELLTEDLIFTNHLGQLLGKNDDLAVYRSGVLKVVRLEPSEQHIKALGEVAVVSVRIQLSGIYEGVPTNGDFRFTRVWARSQQGRWQIVTAHSSLIAPLTLLSH